MMRSGDLIFTCIVLAVTVQFPAAAQMSTDNCTGQPSLDWDDTFGFVEGPTPLSDDFAMTGAGCSPWVPTNCGFNDGFDRVVCFTPTNNCTVLVEAGTGNNGAAAHVFSGSCGEPASCVASIAEDDNAVLLPSVSLTAGTRYCAVVERCGNASISITINQIGGTDCGPLGPLPIFADGFESGDLTAWS
ncbi:MAG: hypothetical protein AAGC60_09970 [Acidobacteriota bacterium]